MKHQGSYHAFCCCSREIGREIVLHATFNFGKLISNAEGPEVFNSLIELSNKLPRCDTTNHTISVGNDESSSFPPKQNLF